MKQHIKKYRVTNKDRLEGIKNTLSSKLPLKAKLDLIMSFAYDKEETFWPTVTEFEEKDVVHCPRCLKVGTYSFITSLEHLKKECNLNDLELNL